MCSISEKNKNKKKLFFNIKSINWRCFWLLKFNGTIKMESRKLMENTEFGTDKTVKLN